MRLVMASIGLSRTQLSTSGLQVGDLKASVTPSLHRCCVDVSVSCSCAHLQGQHDARSRPLLLRSLGPKVSEGTRHHRHALDGLPRRKPCTTAVWDESVSFPRLTTTYVWTWCIWHEVSEAQAANPQMHSVINQYIGCDLGCGWRPRSWKDRSLSVIDPAEGAHDDAEHCAVVLRESVQRLPMPRDSRHRHGTSVGARLARRSGARVVGPMTASNAPRHATRWVSRCRAGLPPAGLAAVHRQGAPRRGRKPWCMLAS